MADFLIEIGTEEIPARMIDAAREEFARRVGDLLRRERLAGGGTTIAYSTPRRLAVLARGVDVRQPDAEEQVTGPAVKVAFKDGAPTAAAENFAKKVGMRVEQLERVTNPKGEYLSARVIKKGRTAAEILGDALPKEIAALYWAKNMYWRGKNAERFVRPVRWIAALLDGEAIPVEFAGIAGDAVSRGHRVLSRDEVRLSRAADYAADLQRAHVMVDTAAREQRIRQALDAATRAVSGAHWREDAALLNKCVNLTEWPAAILGSFEHEFLGLPEEVLVTVMRDHQSYFAVEDASHRLLPHFLAVLNTDGDPEGLIRHGHGRVLRARFKDAQFFWDSDQKMGLRDRVEMLKAVTFQKDLGSYYEKSERVASLANELAADLANSGKKLDRNAIHEAAWLAKTDLTAELVKEFTELQGIVGGLYARAQGLAPTVADAIYDQYKPESTDSPVPRTLEGAVLAIADKADSIAGMFALGLVPSGSKDPFALRRQANGIVKIIAEHRLPLSISELFKTALSTYKGSAAEKKFTRVASFNDDIRGFFRERLEFYLREGAGEAVAYDEVNATLAAGADDIYDAVLRSRAISEVRREGGDAFDAIGSSFKRIKNILRQAHEAGYTRGAGVDTSLLDNDAERALAAAAEAAGPRVDALRSAGDYAGALREIAKLRPVLDTFFDKVMVMAEDSRVRANRLALLAQLLERFSSIADFSEIVAGKK